MNNRRLRLVAVVALLAALAVPSAASAATTPPPPPVEQFVLQAAQQRAAALDQASKAVSTTIAGRNTQITILNQQMAALRANPFTAAHAAALQPQVDALMAANQRDLVALQALIVKRNEASVAVANLMAKLASTRSAIVGNIRP
jgi:hypothetical protein